MLAGATDQGAAGAAQPAVHVVGGRGFVGAAVARALRKEGAQVTVSGREPLSSEVAEAAQVLVWSAGGRTGSELALEAAHVRGPLAALASLPRLRALVYLSSGEVYGAQPPPFPEHARRLGRSCYARAKIRGEDALVEACAARGLRAVLVRPSVVYGPGQRSEQLLPYAIEALRAGRPLALTAGEQTRDWIHVADVARAVAALALGAHRGAFNLGSGQERTVRAALAELAELAGAPAELLRFGALPYRPDEPLRYALRSERAWVELGWRPRVAWRDGLAGCLAHEAT